MTDTDALFVSDGDRFVPTEFSRGPWSADALHGGPVAALLAGLVEQVASDLPMQVSRFTLELERPVPLAPLAVETQVTRPGKRVQVIEQRMTAGDTVVARTRSVRIRTTELDLPAMDIASVEQPPGVEASAVAPIGTRLHDQVAYHSHGVEMRFASGGRMLTGAGPAVVWMRLLHPVIAGQPTTPLERVCGVADFGNGMSSPLDFEQWTFINPDLTVAVHRLPETEWVCLDCRTELSAAGIGLSQSQLFDETGHIGTAVQTLFVAGR